MRSRSVSTLNGLLLSLAGLTLLCVVLSWLIYTHVELTYHGLAFTLMGLLSGSMFTLLLTIILEIARRPVIDITPGNAFRNSASGNPPRDMNTLQVWVKNIPPPWWFRWITRNPALQCYARISFYPIPVNRCNRINGCSMTGRWATSPQPQPLFGYGCQYRGETGGMNLNPGQGILLYDVTRFDPLNQEPLQKMDIYPGDEKPLDVVCRDRNTDECFGWNNEYYIPEHLAAFKTEWPLRGEQYLVEITIFSSAEPATRYFELHNSRENFCLRQPRNLEQPFP